jgi:hypothetical protein
MSHFSGTLSSGMMILTSGQRFMSACPIAYMASTPGLSLSGHSSTERPLSGDQSTLRHAFAPPGQATATYAEENPLRAASTFFSPSTTSTRASGRA